MATRKPPPDTSVDQVDTRFLDSLVGYNARRATLVIVDAFLRNMAVYGLRPVDFSVLSLIGHNPGITSRQLCATLNLQPPNLVGMVSALEQRGLITRVPHPKDRRAVGLHLSPQGTLLMQQAEQTAAHLEQDATARLTGPERKTLIRLLKKIYL